MKVPAQSAASEDQKTALRMALPSSDATFPAQHSLLLFLFTYGDIFGGSGNKFLHMGVHPQIKDPNNVYGTSQVAQW